MRKGRASFTATAVASFRAAATAGSQAACDPGDAAACRLLPRPLASAVGLYGESAPVLQRALLAATFGLADHVALRSARIDEQLIQSVAVGIQQVVILGAGLDSRAHRMAALGGCHVFEVDHPDSQALKMARAAPLPVCAADLRYVPVDFERDALAGALADAGHDPGAPTFWVWEGVVPYLPPSDTQHTLEVLAGLSAAGSALSVSYVVEELIWLRHTGPFFRTTMRLLGEPLRGVLTRQRMATMLTQCGWRLEQDDDTLDWAQSLGTRSPRLIPYERLALATHGGR